eukprot:10973971-Alexandrium_andersonii.AAC.1
MAPNRTFIGKDWNGFGGIRWQFYGHRQCIFLELAELQKHLAPKLPAPSTKTFDDIVQAIQALDEPEMTSLSQAMGTDALFYANLGPADACVVPPGWLCCGKTGALCARGIRRTLLPSTGDLDI